jgi:hypothetical protein
MTPHAVLVASLAVVNIPVYYLLYRLFYRDFDEFMEAIRFWLKPDLWSWIDGEYWDDVMASMKLGIFFSLCSGAVMGEAYLVATYLLTRK